MIGEVFVEVNGDGTIDLFFGKKKYYTFVDRTEARKFVTAVREVATKAKERDLDTIGIPLQPKVFVPPMDALALADFVALKVR